MKKMIVVVLLFLLAPTGALAQKVSQAKGATRLVLDNVGNNSGSTYASAVIDVRGFAGLEVVAMSNEYCRIDPGGYVIVFSSSENSITPTSFAQNVSREYVPGDDQVFFTATNLMDYAWVEATPQQDVTMLPGICKMSVWVTGVPFTSGGVCHGDYKEGRAYSTEDRPVVIAGLDKSVLGTSTVRAVAVDASGRRITVGPVAAGSATSTDAPVKVGGTDGTSVRSLYTDSLGRIIASPKYTTAGTTTDGAAYACVGVGVHASPDGGMLALVAGREYRVISTADVCMNNGGIITTCPAIGLLRLAPDSPEAFSFTPTGPDAGAAGTNVDMYFRTSVGSGTINFCPRRVNSLYP